MRLPPRSLSVALVAQAAAGGPLAGAAPDPAADASLSYDHLTEDCELLLAKGSVPNPVQRCTLRHHGTMRVAAAECDATRCVVRTDGGLEGTASPPAVVLVAGSYTFQGSQVDPVCEAREQPGLHHGIACAGQGAATASVAALGFRTVEVITAMDANRFVGAVQFQAVLRFQVQLCRDADGAPRLSP